MGDHAIHQSALRRGHLKRRYGITPEQYDVLLQAQNSRCRLCGDPPGPRRLAVDHDHVTGRVRGLLCRACNQGLGQFRDSPVILQRAVEYLTPITLV